MFIIVDKVVVCSAMPIICFTKSLVTLAKTSFIVTEQSPHMQEIKMYMYWESTVYCFNCKEKRCHKQGLW